MRTALLRLCGAALACALLLVLFAPLREAAGSVAGAVTRAAYAGRMVAVQRTMTMRYALRYGIPVPLAAAIQRAAMAEGIDPDLAFRLVRVESGFRERAVSPVGAFGLTQLMPTTAEMLQPGITREEIFDRDTNLRLGFRYLRHLLDAYDGDLSDALHAYNRGPGTVNRIRAMGADPSNGYADRVVGAETGLAPYAGSGTVPIIDSAAGTGY